MSVFDLNEQNSNLDSRIIAGLERLSHVFRTLLWQKAGEERLSPIQLRLSVFIRYHAPDMNNVSNLAREFNVTKPDRKRVVSGKCVAVRVDLGGRGNIKKYTRTEIRFITINFNI